MNYFVISLMITIYLMSIASSEETPERCQIDKHTTLPWGATFQVIGPCYLNYCDKEKNMRDSIICPQPPQPADVSKCHYIEQDRTKPFPECCEKYICSE